MFSNYQEISSLIELRRFAHAREKVNNYLAESPNDIELLYWSAYLYWIEDNVIDGIDVCHEALALAPDNHDISYVLFRLYEQDENYFEAEAIIISLLGTFPRELSYLTGYARVMLYTFHVLKARHLCEEALRIDPDYLDSRLVMALIDIVDGRINITENSISELIEGHPDSEHVMHMLIIMLITKRKHKVALTLSQELLRQDPSNLALVEQVVELKKITHWSALPLWPITRFGYPASIGIWLCLLVLIAVNRQDPPSWAGTALIIYLVWVIYTWVHEAIISRFINVKETL